MISFKFPMMAVRVQNSLKADGEIFATCFPDHDLWLKETEIDFHIQLFKWPTFISVLLTREPSIWCEFHIIFENENDALMFRLYSGLTVYDDA
jgi:hypothetical protein